MSAAAPVPHDPLRSPGVRECDRYTLRLAAPAVGAESVAGVARPVHRRRVPAPRGRADVKGGVVDVGLLGGMAYGPSAVAALAGAEVVAGVARSDCLLPAVGGPGEG